MTNILLLDTTLPIYHNLFMKQNMTKRFGLNITNLNKDPTH